MAGGRTHWTIAALALGSSLAGASLAQAQDSQGSDPQGGPIVSNPADTNALDSDTFNRGRNIGVEDRPRPGYQAVGILAGGFTIYPKVVVTADYDDNIFAVQHGAVGDFIFDAVPEIDVQSNWSRNALSAYARLDQDAYAKYSSQDTTQYEFGVAGKLQFGESVMTGGLDYGHSALPQYLSNDFGSPQNPIQYDFTKLNDELSMQFTRLRLSLKVEDQDYQYQNTTSRGGGTVFAASESHNDVIVTGTAEFALTPDAALQFQAQGNHRGYGEVSPTSPFALTSSGYQVTAGANFDLTHLIRGEFQIGYLSQTYVSGAFKPVQGISGKAQLQWFPTQLTTVTFLASRQVGDAQVVGSAGYVGSNVSARVDHELLRNLILSGTLSASYFQNIGIDRNDTLIGAGFSANWLITRHVGLKFAYAYTDQKSVGAAAGNTFADNRGTVSLVLQL
jgi:hypothetical protein